METTPVQVSPPSVVSAFTPNYSDFTSASFIASLAIRGLAGYFVGKLLGYPVAGAVATAAIGMPGMLGVAIYSKHGGK